MCVAVLFTGVFCLFAHAADATGGTASVRLIVGLDAEKAYLPRLRAMGRLSAGAPLSDRDLVILKAFLHDKDNPGDLGEMELAAIKNDVVEYLIKLPGMPGGFARDLLDMQSDVTESATWRNYCVQFMGLVYSATPDAGLRKDVRERLFALIDSADTEACGTALLALASIRGNSEIDHARVASRALVLARDASADEGLRYTALQIAADLGRAEAVALAREWLAREKAVNMRAVAIGVLGKHGAPADRTLIEPYLNDPDPRLSGAAHAALKLPRQRTGNMK